MLVPGSIWERARKKGAPTQSRVLCISNEELLPPASDAFPPQVIFVSDKLKVLTMPVDAFTASRTYVGIDEHVKALADALVSAPDVEDPDDDEEIDFDSVPLPEEEEPVLSVARSDTKKRVQIADLLFGEDEHAKDTPVPTEMVLGSAFRDNAGHPVGGWGATNPEASVVSDSNVESPVPAVFALRLSWPSSASALNSQLTTAFVGYTEAPFHTGDTQHALKFRLSDDLELPMLHNAFSPSDASVDAFNVYSNYETTSVVIDGYIDTFLSVEDSVSYGVVYVTSVGDFRNKEYVDSQIQPEAPAELQVIQNLAQQPQSAAVAVGVAVNPTVQVQVG